MGHPKVKLAEAAARRAQMLRMRVDGMRNPEIAAHFGISTAFASKEISKAVRKAHELEIQEATLWRQLQTERLEQLIAGVWPDASTGDVRAGEQARKYIADLTDLLGIKVPVRTEISGPDGGEIPFNGGSLAELTALISIADQDNADIPAYETDPDDEDDLDDDGEEDDEDEDADSDS